MTLEGHTESIRDKCYSFSQYKDIYHRPRIIRKRLMFQKVG